MMQFRTLLEILLDDEVEFILSQFRNTHQPQASRRKT